MCTGTTSASRRPPPLFVQCQRRFRHRPRRTCAHGPRPRTAQLCFCTSLHAPVVPGSVRVIWCIDDLGCVHPRSRCKCQYQWACILPLSFIYYTSPFPPWLVQLRGLNWYYPHRRPTRTTRRGHYTRHRTSSNFSKNPNSPYAACPCTQRSKRTIGKGRELDWTKSPSTAVDLRAARGATPAHITP